MEAQISFDVYNVGLSVHFYIRRTTEQQEMERIEALQHEVAEQRRRNEASYKAALAGSEYN